jgi:hypothetical protein
VAKDVQAAGQTLKTPISNKALRLGAQYQGLTTRFEALQALEAVSRLRDIGGTHMVIAQ